MRSLSFLGVVPELLSCVGVHADTTAEPDISQHAIAAEDEFLLLASDGLFQDLSSDDVVQYVGDWLEYKQVLSLLLWCCFVACSFVVVVFVVLWCCYCCFGVCYCYCYCWFGHI